MIPVAFLFGVGTTFVLPPRYFEDIRVMISNGITSISEGIELYSQPTLVPRVIVRNVLGKTKIQVETLYPKYLFRVVGSSEAVYDAGKAITNRINIGVSDGGIIDCVYDNFF